MSPDPAPWDGWINAESYDWFVRERPIYRWLNRELAELAEVAAAHRVLDLACGTGATAEACLRVLPRDGELVGVDGSAAMVEVARGRVGDPRARFAVAAASEVGRAVSGRFDRALCNAAFWQFPDPAAVLRTVAGLLSPGALLAFNVPASRVAGMETRSHPFQVALARAVEALGGEPRQARDEVEPALLEQALAEAGLALLRMEMRVYRGTQSELMELMEIPAMLARAAPNLAPADREAALARARRRTDPEQAVEVPWVYWLARRRP